MDSNVWSRPVPSEDGGLCECCSRINLQDLKSSLGYSHQLTWESLLLSSRTCNLCGLFAGSIQSCLDVSKAYQRSLPKDSGPVRLVAAGRNVPQQSHGRRFREGPVDEVLLWGEAALLVGEIVDRQCCFSPLTGAQVIMVAAHGTHSSGSGYQLS